MKSCGDERIEFIISDKGRLLAKRINCTYCYLHTVLLRVFLKRLLLDNGWLIGVTKEKKFQRILI